MLCMTIWLWLAIDLCVGPLQALSSLWLVCVLIHVCLCEREKWSLWLGCVCRFSLFLSRFTDSAHSKLLCALRCIWAQLNEFGIGNCFVRSRKEPFVSSTLILSYAFVVLLLGNLQLLNFKHVLKLFNNKINASHCKPVTPRSSLNDTVFVRLL